MSWPSAPIKEVARVVGGATPKTSVPDYWDGDISWVTPKDLTNLPGKFISTTPRQISATGLKNCAAELLPPNSVLFSSRAPIGHVAINTSPMATNQGFKSMVPGSKLDPNFLYWWLDSHRDQLKALGNGATFKEVSKAVVERVEIPLPPLEEQKRIAAILDQADALRRLRRRALDRLNTLGQAIFHEMFVAEAEDWPRKLIDKVVSNARTGPFGSQLLHSEFVDEGVPVLGIDNVVTNNFVWAQPRFITQEKYRELSRYTVEPADVLITIMGTCGRCAIVPDDIPEAINTKHICCLTPDQAIVSSEYLHAAFLMHPAVLRQLGVQTKGAVMPGLNMGIIKGIEIPVPPLDLQHRFDEKIKTFRSGKEQWQRDELAMDALFASLQHRAFTGQL